VQLRRGVVEWVVDEMKKKRRLSSLSLCVPLHGWGDVLVKAFSPCQPVFPKVKALFWLG